LKSKGKKIL